jgi:hypothetical protein
MSGEVPVTARVVSVERTDKDDVIVLSYIAGDTPVPGQLVALHHGPRPSGYDCDTCADHKVIACDECGGTGHAWWTTDDPCPAIGCEFGDVPCPDCSRGDG